MHRKVASAKSLGALWLLAFAPLLSAQLTGGVQSIALTAQATESIGISLTAGGSVNITLPLILNKVYQGDAVPSWTTSWVLSANRSAVKTYAFFRSTNALVGTNNASNVIPAVNFFGTPNGGSPTAFSAAAVASLGQGGAGIMVSSTTITSGNLTGNKSDSMALSLQANGSLYPADTYTGVLFIMAQATP